MKKGPRRIRGPFVVAVPENPAGRGLRDYLRFVVRRALGAAAAFFTVATFCSTVFSTDSTSCLLMEARFSYAFCAAAIADFTLPT